MRLRKGRTYSPSRADDQRLAENDATCLFTARYLEMPSLEPTIRKLSP